MSPTQSIVTTITTFYPATQAIYLFGSFATPDEWPQSDVDIAVLLPRAQAKRETQLMLSPCHEALAEALKKDVDLINLREVSTVFQNQIIQTGRLLFTGDQDAVWEFEMTTMSQYQRLNDERAAIIKSFEQTGRAYNV